MKARVCIATLRGGTLSHFMRGYGANADLETSGRSAPRARLVPGARAVRGQGYLRAVHIA